MDVKKRVRKKQQKLRLQIENLKITKSNLPAMNFVQASKNMTKLIAQKERELELLETQWKF